MVFVNDTFSLGGPSGGDQSKWKNPEFETEYQLEVTAQFYRYKFEMMLLLELVL
ncbi:MAG: hypothetical protein ACPG3V_02050 [Porticoccaceae bacterium]